MPCLRPSKVVLRRHGPTLDRGRALGGEVRSDYPGVAPAPVSVRTGRGETTESVFVSANDRAPGRDGSP